MQLCYAAAHACVRLLAGDRRVPSAPPVNSAMTPATAWLALCALAACAAACGFTTHDFIAHRAQQYFYHDFVGGGKYTDIIAASVNAVQGGAPFPGALLPPPHILCVCKSVSARAV